MNIAFFVQHLQQVDLTPVCTGDPDAFLMLKNGHHTKENLVRGALFGWHKSSTAKL